MDDFRIQYVGIFNKGLFNKWGNTVEREDNGRAAEAPHALKKRVPESSKYRCGAMLRAGSISFSTALRKWTQLYLCTRKQNMGAVLCPPSQNSRLMPFL